MGQVAAGRDGRGGCRTNEFDSPLVKRLVALEADEVKRGLLPSRWELATAEA